MPLRTQPCLLTLRCGTNLQGLNEVQAYILLRRWVQEQGQQPKDVQLEFNWLLQLTAYYATERSRLLRCIEAMLSSGAVASVASLLRGRKQTPSIS